MYGGILRNHPSNFRGIKYIYELVDANARKQDMRERTMQPDNDVQLLGDIKQRVQNAQTRALHAVSAELIRLTGILAH